VQSQCTIKVLIKRLDMPKRIKIQPCHKICGWHNNHIRSLLIQVQVTAIISDRFILQEKISGLTRLAITHKG